MPNDEVIRILNLVAEGKVTAEDGARLLDAVGAGDDAASAAPAAASGRAGAKGKSLLIRVFKGESGKPHVNVVVPLALAKWALRFAPKQGHVRVGDRDVEVGELDQWLDGVPGEILTVHDEDEGERVEISVR